MSQKRQMIPMEVYELKNQAHYEKNCIICIKSFLRFCSSV